ncbi:Putative cytochrome C-type biogenesis protein [Xanthomarina gelatinilytica]|uniref:Putative cytochrome C-type biogenesis protein n=1 Tax=Xanthomarina gelatinilytica TaxID=1137281 RepID=M7N6G7_9FLAO|nr:cytochrome c biogenesis protein CcsA [Xanthomarina gelatinilytica]EMQ94028.1 Putative cytochrome C-type biogenesis protein [Xanthomarina gelatinilytica]
MQNKITKFLFSTKLTAVLFLVFAASMAIGTFMDAGQDTSPTPYTRNLIYNTWWFEAIMLLFMINFIGNIPKYRLWRKEKWATLILHLAFILIILGAGITRYISFEGMMAIREGDTENSILSHKTYIIAYIDGDYMVNGQAQRKVVEQEVDFSPRMENEFYYETDYNKQEVSFELEKFIGGAEMDVVPDDTGKEYLKIVEAGGGAPHNHFLEAGQVQSIHNILFSLNKEVEGAVNITSNENGLTIQSPFEGEYMTMATGATGKLEKDSIQPLILRSRYVIGNMQMVFPKPVIKGSFDLVKKSEMLRGDENGVVLKITSNGETKRVNLLGGQGYSKPFEKVTVGGLDIAVKYGSKIIELPFSIKLNDFIADKYPGTEKSYSSFASEVTVLDEVHGDFNYRIYMNHILDHGGYRFFQSGFDPDEKGTKLSVNHDFYGTWVTYIGYSLLYFGMLAILFDRKTRFADLKRMLNKVKDKKAKALMMLFLFIGLQGFSQDHSQNDGHAHSNRPTKHQIDSILAANITPKAHADKFAHLVIQDVGGRMMPINTYASEMLRKLSKHDTYEDFDANQVFLSIQESPLLWYNVPIIYLKPQKADSIRRLIGVAESQKYVALVDFFTENGAYKLAPYLEEAYKAQIPNGFQKEFKETDQRVNLLYNTIEGYALRIFPIPDDENNKWISSVEYRRDGYRDKINDSLYGNFINNGFSAYLMTLNAAKQSGDFAKAEELLGSFKKTQHKFGSSVMLSDKKIQAELNYNKYDIFKRLYSLYMYASAIMFLLIIFQIFKERSKALKISINVFKVIIWVFFGLHTLGLIVRWYISGHAPWSDAYESMIYVAWATMLFGLIFGRKSDLTIAATAFVTSMILMVAHWNWMDPSIANLQPVLDSYWLMIHVAVIVASYGPFTLGMILGVVSLLLMIFTTKENKSKMLLNIQELTLINEMALTVGLVLLTIGNFLGGMWANESWGRYWGWDPKETWALISIMIYAFVIHMRLVPGLRGRFTFNLASIVAFSSIMMTYFGVNFYLAGLHSYASGDQIVSVKFIAIAFGIVAVLGLLAYRKYAKFYKK